MGTPPSSSLSRHNSCDVPIGTGTGKRRPSSSNSLRRQSSLINSPTSFQPHENSVFAGIGDDLL